MAIAAATITEPVFVCKVGLQISSANYLFDPSFGCGWEDTWIPLQQWPGGGYRPPAEERSVQRRRGSQQSEVVQQWPFNRGVVSRMVPSISSRRCQGQWILEALKCESGYVLSPFASAAEREVPATPLSHPSAAIWQPPPYISAAAGLHAICRPVSFPQPLRPGWINF